jgi:hypothetical protein
MIEFVLAMMASVAYQAPGGPKSAAEVSEGAEPRSSTGDDQEPAEGRREPWYRRWFG